MNLKKNLALSLISFAFIISFLSCSGERKKIEWILVGNVPVSENIQIGITNANRNLRNKNLVVNKTKTIRINSGERISSLEHDSSLCVIIKQKKDFDVIEIYVYPSCNYIENEDAYIIEPVDMEIYYYIESFDDTVRKNYMLISKDNVIDKKAVINKQQGNLESLLKNFEDDFLYYSTDEQE